MKTIIIEIVAIIVILIWGDKVWSQCQKYTDRGIVKGGEKFFGWWDR